MIKGVRLFVVFVLDVVYFFKIWFMLFCIYGRIFVVWLLGLKFIFLFEGNLIDFKYVVVVKDDVKIFFCSSNGNNCN